MELLLTIFALVWLYILSQRVDKLTKKIDPLLSTKDIQMERDVATQSFHTVSPQMVQPATYGDASVPPLTSKSSFDHFVEWVREDFMMKLGAFLILCALGWFVSYAIINDLIGEGGRILLGLLTGTTFIALAYWRIRTHAHQGGIFAVLGSSIVLLTVFAARVLYDMFNPTSALIIMFLSVAFVALLSVRYDRQALALSSLVLASLAPFFTNTERPDILVQFAYLLVVIFGSLWVVFLRGWSNLTLGALVVTFLYGMPYLVISGGAEKDIALVFAFVFTTIFYVANILGLIGNENEKNRVPHILIALGTGLYLILWIMVAAQEEWKSLLLVAWTLVFSLGSYVVYRVVEQKEAFYIYAGTGIVLLGAATAIELQGAALTIAFTLESGVLVYLTMHLFKDTRLAESLTWLFLLPILLSFESLVSPDWSTRVLHDSFFVLLILMIVLMIVGKTLSALITAKDRKTPSVLVLFSGMYAVALVWLVLHAGATLSDTTATFIALVLYTIAGISFYARGRRKGVVGWTYAGGALIALAVTRLLFVEVWNMELTGRIFTFLVIGSLLLSTAFMTKQHKTITPGDVIPQ